MTNLVLVGTSLQLVALLLCIRVTSPRPFAKLGTLFCGAIFIWHGLSEIAQTVFNYLDPVTGQYREYADRQALDEFVLYVGLASILFVSIYIIIRNKIKNKLPPVTYQSIIPDWRYLIVPTILCYLVEVSGQKGEILGYWISGLVEQFLMPLIILTTLSYLKWRTNQRNFLAFHWHVVIVTGTITTMMLLTGQRLNVVTATASSILALEWFGITLSWRSYLPTFLMILLGFGAITIIRDTVGRESLSINATATERISGVRSGTSASTLSDESITSIVNRIDGNSFGAIINYSLSNGREYAGFKTIKDNFWHTIPSFLYSAKLESDFYDRTEKYYSLSYYGINNLQDFAPTTFGMLFSYFGLASLLFGSALFGVIYALTDNRLIANAGLIEILIGTTLLQCVFFMEQGIIVYFSNARGTLTLWMVIAGMRKVYALVKT